ncbi:hypothetical protein ACFO1B_06460 [Dactylosporangium siamense]|uniref:Uncharacterized protein n=1 Tax=Dactylosporangium siamense TaxID=685454 RepID=A0A919PGW7_9ACTN|nr:hypothetical protein [Dactylosporangium siamense]GIG43399.1 hypothetical protein Dsi01nite_014400 [Dactylosporangium siamense]
MKSKQILALVAVGATLYHLAALSRDAERWANNARRVRANPTPENLIGLLLASGILLADLRSI